MRQEGDSTKAGGGGCTRMQTDDADEARFQSTFSKVDPWWETWQMGHTNGAQMGHKWGTHEAHMV